MLSFVIPTYKEAKNLPTLLTAIAETMAKVENLNYEVLIMDDVSADGSEEIVAQYSTSMPVEMIVRHHKMRGLSESVIDGLYQAHGEYLLVMDADMSHPVSAVMPMVRKLQNGECDFVLGSRYIAQGKLPDDWGYWRWLNSSIATFLARPLIKVNDPMSGFFALKSKDLPSIHTLNPIGYKIALEILIKGCFHTIYEHPINFQDRNSGDSKLTFTEQIKYLRHLRRLYQYEYATWAELAQFALIGSIGFVIDLFFYYVLQLFGLSHHLARACSFWPAVTSNWILNRSITFNHRSYHKPFKQWVSFVYSSLLGFVINSGSYFLMTSHIVFFSEHKILALVVGVVLGMGFNFLFSNLFVFQDLRTEQGVQRVDKHR